MDKKPKIRFKGFDDLPAGRQALGNISINKNKKWCAYVLECNDGSLYKGKTNNLKRRISEHINGIGAKYTQHHKPIKLIYVEFFDTEIEAIEKEKYLKSGIGRELLQQYRQVENEK